MLKKLKNNKGQGVVEYGLIIGLIIVIIIAAYLALKPRIQGVLTEKPHHEKIEIPAQ